MDSFSCFKAYDVRGRIPDQLNEDIAYRIGRAYAAFLQPKTVVVGYDIRLSSQSICGALSNGLMDSGVNVFHRLQGDWWQSRFLQCHTNRC